MKWSKVAMAAKILLVEDDWDQAVLFARVLETSGHTVVAAATAEEAQARLAAESFDLLLADWDLGGGMNGDALICWAKTRYPGMKTILFSNHLEVNEIAAACGADAALRNVDGIGTLRRLVACLTSSDTGNE